MYLIIYPTALSILRAFYVKYFDPPKGPCPEIRASVTPPTTTPPVVVDVEAGASEPEHGAEGKLVTHIYIYLYPYELRAVCSCFSIFTLHLTLLQSVLYLNLYFIVYRPTIVPRHIHTRLTYLGSHLTNAYTYTHVEYTN